MIRKILSKLKNIFYINLLNKLILYRFNFFHYKKKYPPIFIVGSPRSGTTLVYQSLISYFDLGYINNFNCYFFGNMNFSENLFKRNKNINFESNFGNTKGLNSPSECGNFWYLFFKRNIYNKKDLYLTKNKQEKLKKYVYSFSYTLKKNIVYKNVYNSMRIEELANIFPKAIFIFVKRNKIDTAHSILYARYKLYGNYNKWFSLKPFDLLETKDPIKDTIKQVDYINLEIEKSIKKIKNSFYVIDYNVFCKNPKKILSCLEKLFIKSNVQYIINDNFPNNFKINKKIKIPIKMYNKLKNYV
jgi:hypothetical protein